MASKSVTQTAYSLLLQNVQKRYPQTNKAEIDKILWRIHAGEGGSLSGFTVDTLTDSVLAAYNNYNTYSTRDQGTHEQHFQPTSDRVATYSNPNVNVNEPITVTHNSQSLISLTPPPGLAHTNTGAASTAESKGKEEKEGMIEMDDTCRICLDGLNESDSPNLLVANCGHIFHDNCLKKWLVVNSVCPNCKQHTLVADDFPALC